MRLFNGAFTEENLNYYKDRMDIPYEENNIAIGLIKLVMDIYNMNPASFDSFSYPELKDAVYKDIERLDGSQIECILNYYDLKDHHKYRKEHTWSQPNYRLNISNALFYLYYRDKYVSSIYQLLFARTLILDENKGLKKKITELEKQLEKKNQKIKRLEGLNGIDNISIDSMNFSVRTRNCLNHAEITTLSDLAGMKYDDFMKVRNLGRKSIDEITEKLKEYGITVEHA